MNLCCEECVYVHMSACVDSIWTTVATKKYGEWNNIKKSGNVRIADWIFITGLWLCEYVTLGNTFQNLLFIQDVVATSVTSTFLPYRIPWGGLYWKLLVILWINYNIITFIINNSCTVINNNLWKNPRPHFALQNSPGHTGELLRNL